MLKPHNKGHHWKIARLFQKKKVYLKRKCYFYDLLQDSILALQALTAFGARDTNRELYNIRIDVTATSVALEEYIMLNQANWMTLQTVSVCIVCCIVFHCR